MKILLHSGVGNLDRPNRWKFVTTLFINLSKSLRELGHDTVLLVHPSAIQPQMPQNTIITAIIPTLDNFDAVFTWNGNSEGDKELRFKLPDAHFIYGELGILNHYNETCYFDSNGINTTLSDLSKPILLTNENTLDIEINNIIQSHKKPRLHNDPYIFVPLQDETDTQIVQYSPFKTMYSFVEYVINLLRYDTRKILIKQHPMHISQIPTSDKISLVTDDVHHYIPYADLIIGLNSTVLVETLYYHSRILSVGLGIASKKFTSEHERKQYMINITKKQMAWDDLKYSETVKNQIFYKDMIELYNFKNIDIVN